jgi:cytochrome c oxidase cbb3-type subunit 3
MADMPTEFWGGYIVGVTVLTLAGLIWLIYNVYFSGQTDPELEDADHVWDEDLREGVNPAPLWWFWLILALLAFSVLYLLLYPGLGTFRGALDWSQGGEISAALARFDEEFGVERSRLAGLSAAELRNEPGAADAGAHLYRVHCSACHGMDADGQAALFPDLTDTEWQWGSSEAEIAQTITGGRTAVMPPWQAAVQDEGVAELTAFTLAMSEGRADDPAVAAGRTRYSQLCIACHGADGGGNVLLGAPALNDDNWLYGGDYEAVRVSIADGRTGIMPPFGERLDATQIKLLTAWLLAER